MNEKIAIGSEMYRKETDIKKVIGTVAENMLKQDLKKTCIIRPISR